MNITSLRGSSANTWQDCQLKYFLNYVCDIPSKGTIKTHCGTIVHHVLEIMARSRRLGNHTKTRWYNNPEKLMDVVWKRYTQRVHPNFAWTKAEYNFCLKSVHAVLNTDYHPFKANVIATEKQFQLQVKRSPFKDFELRGTIDFIAELDSTTLSVVDYKSGKRSDWISGAVKELEHFKKDLQFQLYNLVLKVLYPQYKVRVFTVFYTSDGGPFTFYFTEEEEKEAWEKIRRIYSEILASEMPERLKDDYTRKATHWKCKNVCQFGREFLVKYKDINSDRIERHIIDKKDLVSCFEDQGTIWEARISE